MIKVKQYAGGYKNIDFKKVISLKASSEISLAIYFFLFAIKMANHHLIFI